jgi:hypothetical protein
MNSETSYIHVCVLENLIEAQVLAAALDERGLPYRIRSYHDTAYDGLFQLQKGWGEIQAPESAGAEIKRIVEDIRL